MSAENSTMPRALRGALSRSNMTAVVRVLGIDLEVRGPGDSLVCARRTKALSFRHHFPLIDVQPR